MWTWIIVGVVVLLVLLLCFALAVANFAFDNFMQKFEKFDKIENSYGLTALEYVNEMNEKLFDRKLSLSQTGLWQDHYSSNNVALSQKTMQSGGLASLAIISHELGHAKQDFSGNKLNKFWKERRMGRICGYFFLPFLLAGTVLSFLWVFSILSGIYFLVIGICCFAAGILIFLFAIWLKYCEIKIEKEASEFAIEFLQDYLLQDELNICRKFLNSARLTYWASLIDTLLGWTHLTKKVRMFQ